MRLIDFLDLCHKWTEYVRINVVGQYDEDNGRFERGFALSENTFKDLLSDSDNHEYDRLKKYYADVPVWNLHIDYKEATNTKGTGRWITGVLVVNCHWMDVKRGYLAEKDDIRRKKMKERREKAREKRKE